MISGSRSGSCRTSSARPTRLCWIESAFFPASTISVGDPRSRRGTARRASPRGRAANADLRRRRTRRGSDRRRGAGRGTGRTDRGPRARCSPTNAPPSHATSFASPPLTSTSPKSSLERPDVAADPAVTVDDEELGRRERRHAATSRCDLCASPLRRCRGSRCAGASSARAVRCGGRGRRRPSRPARAPPVEHS